MSTTSAASRHPGDPPRSVAALVVPLLIVVLLAVIALVVMHSLNGANGPSTPASGAPKHAQSAYWTVRAGDSYTSIAAKTGLSVKALKRLNPRQDPAAIRVGRRLRLRRGSAARSTPRR